MKRLMELSSQQKNIWNSEMFYSKTNINNIGGYLLINQNINISLLEKSANIYIKTNEALRLHFDLKNGEPVQFITDYSPFKLKKVTLKSLNDLYKLTTELVSKPFEVINSNLYNFTLFTLPDGKGGIIPVFHHLIGDAWSMSLFITRFINIYSELLKGNNSFEDTPKYSDYIISCNEYKKSDRYLKDKKYWENSFAYYWGWQKRFRVNVLTGVMYAEAKNKIVIDFCNILIQFWKECNKLPDYFLFQIMIDVYKQNNDEWDVPIISDAIPHLLRQKINDDYPYLTVEEILNRTSIHSLSRKNSNVINKLKEILALYEQ